MRLKSIAVQVDALIGHKTLTLSAEFFLFHALPKTPKTLLYHRQQLALVLAHNDAIFEGDKLESYMKNSREIFTRHEGNM